MLGQKTFRPKLFYAFSLEEAVSLDNFYRKLEKAVDLSWVCPMVAHCYDAHMGRPSIDPEVIVKIELIGYLENITSERQLMDQISDRLSLRRYIGYDLDEEVPDHSTLSRARELLGRELFQEVFDQSVRLCQAAGMIGGVHVSGDRTLIKANASIDSMEPRLVQQMPREYIERVFAENPVEGDGSGEVDSVVRLVDRPEYPARLGVVREEGAVRAGESASTVSEGFLPGVGAADNGGDGGIRGREGLKEEEEVVAEVVGEGEVMAGSSQGGDIQPVEGQGEITGALMLVEGDTTMESGEEVEEAIAGPADGGGGATVNACRDGQGKGRAERSNATHVSRTDPDATLVTRPGNGTMLAHSVEYWTDSRAGVITHVDADTGVAADHRTVMKAVLRQREVFGLPVASLSYDKGSGRGRLYRQLKDAGVVAFIPYREQANSTSGPGLYGLESFVFDEERNVYACPGGHELGYSHLKVRWPWVSHVWEANAKDCQACALRSKCTKGKAGRRLQVGIYQKEYEEMTARLGGRGARLAAIARRTGPEPRFGEGKQWHGLGKAKYRGQDKVRGQALLTASAQNFKKYVRWVWRKGQGAGVAGWPKERRETSSLLSNNPLPFNYRCGASLGW